MHHVKILLILPEGTSPDLSWLQAATNKPPTFWQLCMLPHRTKYYIFPASACFFGSLNPPFLPCTEWEAMWGVQGGEGMEPCLDLRPIVSTGCYSSAFSLHMMLSPSLLTFILRDAVPVSTFHQSLPAASLAAKEPPA